MPQEGMSIVSIALLLYVHSCFQIKSCSNSNNIHVRYQRALIIQQVFIDSTDNFHRTFYTRKCFLPLKVLILSLSKKWAFPACSNWSLYFASVFISLLFYENDFGADGDWTKNITSVLSNFIFFLLFNELLEALKHCSVVYFTHVHD